MGAAVWSLAQSIDVFRAAFANVDLRRVQLAFIGFNVAEYGTWIAVMVFAYGVGGTTASGIIGAVQLIPAALFAPFASILGDRYPRNRVLVAGYLAQAISMSLAGVAMMYGVNLIVIYALAAVTATSVTLTRPVQGALLPSLVRSPAELVAANVAGSWVEGLSLFVGPLATGLLLAVSTPGVTFLVMGGVVLSSALLTAGVTEPEVDASHSSSSQGGAFVQELTGGIAIIATEQRPRLVVLLMAANFLLIGAIDVLLVVLAIRLLGLGSPGVGYLNAAFGLGGLVAAIGATTLAVRRHLAPVLLGAGFAWAVGLALVGVLPSRATAPLLIVVAGAGKPLIDVVGRILLQRVVADQLLSRVFGGLEGLSMAAQAVGMVLVPILVSLINPSLTFIAFGAFLPLLTLGVWRGLTQIDAIHIVAEDRFPLLRSLPIFAPLPASTLLRLAGQLTPVSVPSGTVIIREGETGDRFYIIRDGTVSVSVRETPVGTLAEHGFFGEIALIRDIPRTATVTADTNTSLFALERKQFLEAVTGHARSMEAAQAASRARLGEDVEEEPVSRGA